MGFKSPTEAIFFILDKLEELPKSPARGEAIHELRIFFENHLKDKEIINQILNRYKKNLERTAPSDEKIKYLQLLDYLIQIIEKSNFSPELRTPLERFENPLSRFFESQITYSLLHQPTNAMMTAVKQVSLKLIEIIKKLPLSFLRSFQASLVAINDTMVFNGFSEVPTKHKIYFILLQNLPKDLPRIMFMHFKFSEKILRCLTIDASYSNPAVPQGKLKEVIASFNEGEFKNREADFFRSLNHKTLSFIADIIFYGSDLYNSPKERGRLNRIKNMRDTQEGLFLASQNLFAQQFPKRSLEPWIADVRAQDADLTSPYVTDLINNDAVYVAGPSGMTSLFLSQMECLCNFQDIADKQNYLTAVLAYLGAGGYHSIHEIIGPAQYCLGLVPGYNIAPPSPDRPAPPPNFFTFFTQQDQIDPEFCLHRHFTWVRCIEFYRSVYKKCSPEKIVAQDIQAQTLITQIQSQLEIEEKETGLKSEYKKNILKIYLEDLLKGKSLDISKLEQELWTSLNDTNFHNISMRGDQLKTKSEQMLKSHRTSPEQLLLAKLNQALSLIPDKPDVKYSHQRGALSTAIEALIHKDSSKIAAIKTNFPKYNENWAGLSETQVLIDEVLSFIESNTHRQRNDPSPFNSP